MKSFKMYAVLSVLYFTASSCGPSLADCNDTPAYIERLISTTPIQSVFQVGDTLKIECSIPSQNTYFAGFDRNIFRETGDATALWSFGNGVSLYENQQLIVRKGAVDGPKFVAIYNLTCDCYDFEADLIFE